MFELIQVAGGTQSALLTIPPVYTFSKGGEIYVYEGSPLVTPVVIPENCSVRKLGWFMRWAVHPAAMMGSTGTIWLNSDKPYLLTETVVHELVHYHQSLKMGRASYIATYVAQYPGALIQAMRKGGKWHQYHLMEQEADWVAKKILRDHFYNEDGTYRLEREREPVNVFPEIERILSL
jgi:hypothetical protein